MVERRRAWRQAFCDSGWSDERRESCTGCGCGCGGRRWGRGVSGRGGGGGRRSVSSRVRREPVGRHSGGQVARGHAAAPGPAGECLSPPFGYVTPDTSNGKSSGERCPVFFVGWRVVAALIAPRRTFLVHFWRRSHRFHLMLCSFFLCTPLVCTAAVVLLIVLG